MDKTKLFLAGVLAASLLCSGLAGAEGGKATAPEGTDQTKSAVSAPMGFDAEQPEGTKTRCPVMKEEFQIAKDTLHSEYKGKHYYFCCSMCKGRFDSDPEKYLSQ